MVSSTAPFSVATDVPRAGHLAGMTEKRNAEGKARTKEITTKIKTQMGGYYNGT
jgi:hypothetical protein